MLHVPLNNDNQFRLLEIKENYSKVETTLCHSPADRDLQAFLVFSDPNISRGFILGCKPIGNAIYCSY